MVRPSTLRPEGTEDRGEHDHREHAGEEGHRHAGVGEAPQEREREDEQRAQRGRHGDRAEGHGAAGGADGALHRDVGLVARSQLLAEAGDHEQRVVDRQAEAHGGREVEAEDRHLGDRAEQAAARRRCRRPTARRWRAGSDADTTLPNTSSSRMSVIGRAIVSARTRSSSIVAPTSLNTSAKPPTRTSSVAVALVLRGEVLDPLVHLVLRALDPGQDQGAVAAVAPQRWRVAGRPVGDHVGDVGLGGQLLR